jgi:23S rRNA A2030 N6-methylase RlmJ
MDFNLEKNNDNTSDIVIKISKYDHNKKIELANKINKIKKKEYLVQIFKLIASESKDFTENTNGVFVFFHNLDDDIYEKVESYVNHIYKLHKKKNSIKNILSSELSDSIINCSDNIDSEILESEIDLGINKELSNKEKMIMRRKKYEEYLTQNQKI